MYTHIQHSSSTEYILKTVIPITL